MSKTQPHFSENIQSIYERSQALWQQYCHHLKEVKPQSGNVLDPLNLSESFMQLFETILKNPQLVIETQISLWKDLMQLWQQNTQKLLGQEAEDVITTAKGDRRFKHADWQDHVIFNFIKQSYLLTANHIQNMVDQIETPSKEEAKKIQFFTKQFIDALSPTNFVLTNPEVLRKTLETGGENLVKGLGNLLRDLEKGEGKLKIQMTDETAFEVGKNIAVTKGDVIFRNDLIELIHYTPSTKTVYANPVLILPPWINKYYILDLRPDNSLVKWLVDHNHQVFMVSWRNPTPALKDKSFEDYLKEGPLAALDHLQKLFPETPVNMVGYCLGGTLLAALLGYLHEHAPERVASATFLASLIDFKDVGDLKVFLDDKQLQNLEQRMEEQGVLDSHAMATTFNMLRANDLIWSFVIQNYLLGNDSIPFDLLYWNSDSTAMPAAMHKYYLRNMYQKNLLSKPGGLTMLKTKIDLSQVKTPSFFLSTKEDHITPWQGTYDGFKLFKGPKEFCLSGSGHIAGVVNPPIANKYGYFTNPQKPNKAETWLENATEHPSSWWGHWQKWLNTYSGKLAPVEPIKRKAYKKIEPAPGSYVKKQ